MFDLETNEITTPRKIRNPSPHGMPNPHVRFKDHPDWGANVRFQIMNGIGFWSRRLGEHPTAWVDMTVEDGGDTYTVPAAEKTMKLAMGIVFIKHWADRYMGR